MNTVEMNGRDLKVHTNIMRRALLATIIGNALEWYDFIVYGFLAVFIAKQFFPPGDETAALLASFATFGLSFIVRPIGGILLGLYADRAGRRAALSLIMASMTIAMLIMVLVPPYSSIGVAATVLMIVARLLQAASAGGEFASAATYLLESVPERKRGLYSGLYSAGPAIATVLAALVGLWISVGMSPETRDSWGWRVPFAIGMIIAPVGLYVRRHLPETEIFTAAHERPGAMKLALFKHHYLSMFLSISLAAVTNSAAYILLVYAPTYVVRALKLPIYIPFVGLVLSGVIGTVFTPLFGALADRIGRRVQLNIGLILLIVCVVPVYIWLNSAPSIGRLLTSSAIFALVMASNASVLATMMAHFFPSEIRSSAMAISYNISATVFGGLSLYFVTLLIAHTHSPLVPAYYLLGIAAVCFVLVNSCYKRVATYDA